MKLNGHALNILRCYHHASADEMDSGLRWYATARGEIESRLPTLPTRMACGVVASLSPQTAWERNIGVAERLIAGHRHGSTAARVAVALRILEGTDPVNALKGPKTAAFFRCLADPADNESVCVDGHAYAIWAGVRLATSAPLANFSRSTYRIVAEDYRVAACAIGVLPSQIQAITWLAWRRLYPAANRPKNQPSQFQKTIDFGRE